MPDPLEEVKERLSTAIASRELHQDTILFMFPLLRQHLDGTPAAMAGAVRHYANWLVHTSLTKEGAKNMLDEATLVLGHSPTETPNDYMVEVLQLKQLRHQIKSLLAGHPAAALFDSLQFWKEFTGFIFQALLDKPLERTTVPALTTGGMYVKALTVTKAASGGYVWRAMLQPKSVTLTGPLVLPETRADFSED